MWQNGTRLTRDEYVITVGENVLRSDNRWTKRAEAPGSGNQEGFLRSVPCRSEWSENCSVHPVAYCCFTTVECSLAPWWLRRGHGLTKCKGGRTRKEGNGIGGFKFLIQ